MTIPNTIIKNTGAMIANSTAMAPSCAVENFPALDFARAAFPKTDFFSMAQPRLDTGIYAHNF